MGGLGVADYSKTGQEVDTSRWTAREIFVGGSGVRHTKCDVWSYACTLWEIVTLGISTMNVTASGQIKHHFRFTGGTPYAEVKTSDLGGRLQRGLRLPRTRSMSDDLYQLMLECWQDDLDERPTFTEIKQRLVELAAQGAQVNRDFSLLLLPSHFSSDFFFILSEPHQPHACTGH